MLVKNIIIKTLNLINNTRLIEAIDKETATEDEKKEINLILSCVNLTNSNIATNYVKLYDQATINNQNGVVPYSKISSKQIFDIVSVKNLYGTEISFLTTVNGLSTKKGDIVVKYTYFPDDLTMESVVENYPIKLSERVFVYGVLSEYLYVKGVFDEAAMWEKRFKKEMFSIYKPQKSVKLKAGRWC